MLKKAAKPKVSRTSRNDDETEMNEPLGTPVTLGGDIDSDVDPIEHDVSYNIQSVQSAPLMSLVDFFNDAKIINPSGDPTTNIIDRLKGKCYNVPERRIPKMFQLIENCRRGGVRLMITERQTGSSGIMLDFDMYQDSEDDQLTDEIFHTLITKVFELLMSILNFKEKKEVCYVGITRKPKIAYNDEQECYKDGFHMLIPSIKVTKGVRLLIIQKLIENEFIDRIMTEVEPADMVIKGQKYTRSDFLDKMSAHVPVFFIGSATKKGSSPYHLSHVFKVTVNTETKNIYILPDADFYRNSSINICHEFSLNFECPKGIIKKKDYEPQDKFATAVSTLEQKATNETEDVTANFGALSMNSIHDSQINEIKSLLDVLNVRRAEDYGEWRNVLCALANTSPSYKDLAEYFSRKSKKFNMVDFEKVWIGCTNSSAVNKKPLTIASIHYWAKTDNPERYKTVRESNVFNILYNMVYEGYREGILNHADVGKLCYALLQHKFVTDIPDGERKRSWFEFILDNDDHVDGELYKWHRWTCMPSSLSLYISETLPKLFTSVFKRVKQNYENSTGDISKYYAKVLMNFKATMRKLGDRNFKKNVVLEAEDKFAKRGFCDKLDKDPLVRGVCNGVLKLSITLGGRPQLIQGYHTYCVSKFTTVPYYAFDPYDVITKKILKTVRNLFPDDEPDSFKFTMCYLSSTIDGMPKESMFMMTVGGGSNGKSFIMEIHKACIGDTYGVKVPIDWLTNMSSNAEGATNCLMLFKDASLVTYSESNKHAVLNGARIKEATGQEKMAGRKNYGDMINFKPKCHHWLCSNYDLDVGGATDHGLWRRIEYNPLKIKFVDPKLEPYDENDPYQRIADDAVTQSWTEDPEILGRYMGIMTWFHYKLYRDYRGKVKSIPHPHINFETEKYRRRQDVIASFIAQRFVKTADATNQYEMIKEIQKYIKWHALNHGAIPAKGLIETFQNSQISKHIKLTKRGLFLTGHRFLDTDEKLDDGEEYAMKHIFDLAVPDDNFGIIPETTDQFYERTCREYDDLKHIFSNDPKYDVAIDTVVDYNAIGGNTDNLDSMTNNDIPKHKPRNDNLEINGRILSCGVVLHSLDSPSRKIDTYSYHADLSGYIEEMEEMEEMEAA
jgi:phage/plasmid-associated DNA primase